MSTRSQREKASMQNGNQVVLATLLKEDCNKYCSDCGAKGPRWASWNLGVFLCIRCAGIHRNLGVHISKVKSVNLDSWTPEQMENIQEWGNRRAGMLWECFLPKDFQRPQTNSAVETFIRNKYEHKKYAKKDGPPPKKNETASATSNPKPEKLLKKKKLVDDIVMPKLPETKASKTSAPVVTSAVVSRPKPQETLVAPSVAKPNPPSVDLLSLDTPAPVAQPISVTQTNSIASELMDFGAFQGPPQSLSLSPSSQPQQLNSLSQTASPVSNEESFLKEDPSTSKSTKDSIMSLYTAGGSAQQQPKMYGVPGGMYITPQQPSQLQKNPHSMYNGPMHGHYPQQQHVVPLHMQQQQQQQQLMHHATPHQQQAQISQVQQQMQHIRLQKNQQVPLPQQQQQQQQQQQPAMFGNHNMFSQQQAMNSFMTNQHTIHYQQQQQPQFVSTGPSANIHPMGGMPSSGHTLNNQLWK